MKPYCLWIGAYCCHSYGTMSWPEAVAHWHKRRYGDYTRGGQCPDNKPWRVEEV